jgi:hypothetical protein
MIELIVGSIIAQTGVETGGGDNLVRSACAAAIYLVIDDITDGWSREENLGGRNVFDFYDRFVCAPEEGRLLVSTYQRNASRGGIGHYLVDVIDTNIIETHFER